jgi:hypothetical protein
MFTAVFTEDTGILPGEIDLNVVGFSWTDRGGPDTAEIRAAGHPLALWNLLHALGKFVVIYNDFGTAVWWGFVNAITVSTEAAKGGKDLKPMFNRIRVMYTAPDATGASATFYTAWAEDLDSQTEYGIKEISFPQGDSSASLALAKRDTALAESSQPPGVVALGGGSDEDTAKLECVGSWYGLAWRYYTNLYGRIENVATGSEAIAIGWRRTATAIGFTGEAIHDVDCGLAALAESDKVAVSGSGSNNTVFQVSGTTNDSQRINTSTGIWFDGPDDIWDDNGWLVDWPVNTFLRIANADVNNGYWYNKQTVSATRITISPSVSGGDLTSDTKGPSITLTAGHYVKTTGGGTNEKPGSSVTLTLYGYRMAQSFVAPMTMTISQLALRLGKIGLPSDNLTVDLCANSGGNPGTVLATATIAGSSIDPSGGLADYWLTFANTTLTNGVTYWLDIKRSGSVDASAYYRLGLSTTTYGTTKAWTGAAWVAFDYRTAKSIGFRLWDAEDTSAAVARIVQTTGQHHVTGTDMAATGVYRNQYVDNDARALTELEKLIDAGTSTGQRLVAEVGRDHVLRVWPAPSTDENSAPMPMLHTDGVLRDQFGSAWEDGVLPVGMWWKLADVPDDVNALWRMSPQYVVGASFSVRDRRLRPTYLAARRILDQYAI